MINNFGNLRCKNDFLKAQNSLHFMNDMRENNLINIIRKKEM